VQFDPKKTIFLIDGSSILYRGYYGMRPLHTSKGEPVQAVYSFCRMFKKLVDQFKPEYIALVWDSKGKTTRHEMFPEYKATRDAPPSDLFEQKKHIMQFADLIGVAQVAQTGIEADDLMFSIAQELTPTRQNGFDQQKQDAITQVILVTSDKDMGQMLSEHVSIYDPMKEEVVTPASFAEKMGFPVTKLPFYFALLGDTSDNIPGVKGIGKKTAQELVTSFDSLQDLYNRLDTLKQGRARTALEAHKQEAFLSEKLFLLQYHAQHKSLQDFAFDKQNWKNALPIFQELEFKSLVQGIASGGQQAIGASPFGAGVSGESTQPATLNTQDIIAELKQKDFQLVTTQEQLIKLCGLIKKKGAVAFDTETDGLEPLAVKLVGISFSCDDNQAFYIPCGHITGEQKNNPEQKNNYRQAVIGQDLLDGDQGEQAEQKNKSPEAAHAQLSVSTIVAHLAPIFTDKNIAKYAHNLKYDQLVLANHGIELAGPTFDTFIAASLVTKSWQSSALKKLSVHYFNEPMLTYDHMVKEQGYKDFSYVPLESALYYAANDARQTWRLVPILKKELADTDMQKLFESIELPLIQVLVDMERTGIYLDTEILARVNRVITNGLGILEQEITNFVHTPINLNSPRQVGHLLFEQLQLTPPKKPGHKKAHSTDHEVLTQLAKEHPVPGLILKYRELAKLKNTYLDALPTYINKKTGRIHTSYSQARVATGRLASSDPNMQNIPTTEYGIAVRGAFKPKEGHVFISADYSQIELRVLAHLSQDSALIDAFNSGLDIHAQTAARLFDVPVESVTHEQRQLGKRINFSVLYGLTPYGLSKDLDIPFKEAKLYIEKYFAQYPRVSSWMEEIVAFAHKYGYVVTHWGRRRDVPGIFEKNRALYEEAKRIAVNTVAQGTAAEIMKIGMIHTKKALEERGLDAQLILQIHDELLLSACVEQQEAVERLVSHVLGSVAPDWTVPLLVTTRRGADWKEVSK
jgi:DNA polymerase-1